MPNQKHHHKSTKPSLTIAIPAFNEEKNIAQLLDSINRQQADNFNLEKIIVMADGCNDRTEEIVRKYGEKSPVVELLSDGQRIGKSQRLNQIYEKNNSEILITLDADIMLEGEDVFENLLKKIKDPEVSVAAGNSRPLPGRTFMEKTIVAKDAWWYEVRKDFRGGNNIYSSSGQCFAMKNEFVKNIKFFPGAINDQEIIYLEAIRQKKRFVFAKEAIVRYREASSWREVLSRARRFEHQDNLAQYGLGMDIDKEYRMPVSIKLKELSKGFFRNPFYTMSSLFLIFLLKLPVWKKDKEDSLASGMWQITKSTKRLF